MAGLPLDSHALSLYHQKKNMSKNTVRYTSIILLLISLGLWSSIIIPSFIKEQQKATDTEQETVWQEQTQELSDVETATMSASFTEDFKKNLSIINATPTPPVFFTADIPASMSGDLTPPTVTIQGSIAEGTTITSGSPCFPLWVSDNMTPWQQLITRGKINTNQWSIWMETFSYCFPNLGNGTHVFTVQIRDLAGNISPEIKRTFIVKQ